MTPALIHVTFSSAVRYLTARHDVFNLILIFWKCDGSEKKDELFLLNEDVLRMYSIDTGAIAFMLNGGSSCGSTVHPIDTKICMVYLCY